MSIERQRSRTNAELLEHKGHPKSKSETKAGTKYLRKNQFKGASDQIQKEPSTEGPISPDKGNNSYLSVIGLNGHISKILASPKGTKGENQKIPGTKSSPLAKQFGPHNPKYFMTFQQQSEREAQAQQNTMPLIPEVKANRPTQF